MVLQGIIAMLGAPNVWELLPEGAVVNSLNRGKGLIRKIDPTNGKRTIEFAQGEQHKYTAKSMYKFTFPVDQPIFEWNDTPPLAYDPLLEKALMLCIAWDTPQLVRGTVRARQKPAGGNGFLAEVGMALQRALEAQRCVTRCCSS